MTGPLGCIVSCSSRYKNKIKTTTTTHATIMCSKGRSDGKGALQLDVHMLLIDIWRLVILKKNL